MLLAEKIGPASGIKKVDALIKAIKGRNKVVFDVIKKLSFQQLGLPEYELTDSERKKVRGDEEPEPEAVTLASLEGYVKPDDISALVQGPNSSTEYDMNDKTRESIVQSLSNPDLKTAKQICTSIAHLECTRMGGSGYYAVSIMLVDKDEFSY